MDWNGRWRVEATIPGGGAYSGHIDISPFGPGHRLRWTISDGDYAGVGLAVAEGLYVSCGPAFDGLSLMVATIGGEGLRLTAGGNGAAIASRLETSAFVDGSLAIAGGDLASVRIEANGDALNATVETGAGFADGLAWKTRERLAVAFGAPLDRLVILFYPTPVWPDDLVEGRWALGRYRTLAVERLRRAGQ